MQWSPVDRQESDDGEQLVVGLDKEGARDQSVEVITRSKI